MSALSQLLELLSLERIERDLFRGFSVPDGRDRLFGGQVLAQSLMAAQKTVEGRDAHSLHAYFLRPGNPTAPILFEVDRIRDGRSFTTRRVVAIQKGEAVFNMSVSFQSFEEGPERQIDLPELGDPEGVAYEEEIRKLLQVRGAQVERDDRRFQLPIEVLNAGGMNFSSVEPLPAELRTWLRARGDLPDDLSIHQCVLAYATDFTVMVPSVRPLPTGMGREGVQSASLDHAMWFHRAFRADDWLLHLQDSPVTAHNRGMGRGTIYDRAGRIVASCAQEGLIRIRSAEPTPTD
ncbi:acyl-CoA thioesterase II [Myxococcota bacterium]|nr:acyl-CoA thioesterase II [Myxococcota bacterium]